MIAIDHHATPSAATLPAGKPRGMPRAEMIEEPTGKWRYDGVGWTRIPMVVAVFVSLALHGIFLFGFNRKPAPKHVAATQDVEIVQMTMPELEEEKSDQVEELTEAADEAPAVAVPQLADLPSSVAVATFVQPLQYTPDVSASLAAARTTQIPVNIGRSRNLQNMGTIFEISQLDRAPSPIMQPAPIFPYQLKKDVSEARVMVEFIVDSNGDVVAPFVTSTTHPGFNDNAVAGVAKWKFRPGMKAGKRVNTRVRVPVNFFVEEDK
jgi:protein TonB